MTRQEYHDTLLPAMKAAAWKRTALVTDVDWITHALHLFAWLTPGEVKAYGLDGLEDAKAWVAG